MLIDWSENSKNPMFLKHVMTDVSHENENHAFFNIFEVVHHEYVPDQIKLILQTSMLKSQNNFVNFCDVHNLNCEQRISGS